MPALKPRNPHRNAPEYVDRVNLIKKIKIGKEWRFAPVVPEANGRLKDKVRVNGQVEVHIEGSYFIEWWVSGRRFRETTTREDAIECARHKTVELRAIRAGLIASPEPQPEAEAKTLIGDAIDDYLKYVKMQRRSRTFLTYRYTLDVLLRASYKRKYVEDATRQDAIDFMTYCYEQGLGARTVYDKVVTVLQLFKRHGREKLLEKGDWPSYVDTIRPIYEPEELTAMFKVATEDEADMLKFILGSGFRDQEIRYVEYLDLDSNHDLRRRCDSNGLGVGTGEFSEGLSPKVSRTKKTNSTYTLCTSRTSTEHASKAARRIGCRDWRREHYLRLDAAIAGIESTFIMELLSA